MVRSFLFPGTLFLVFGRTESASTLKSLPEQIVNLSVDAAQFVIRPLPQGIKYTRIGTQ